MPNKFKIGEKMSCEDSGFELREESLEKITCHCRCMVVYSLLMMLCVLCAATEVSQGQFCSEYRRLSERSAIIYSLSSDAAKRSLGEKSHEKALSVDMVV